MTDAFFGLNADYEFTYVNDRAAELLGHDADDLAGRNVWEAFPAAADSAYQTEYERAMETQKSVAFEEYYPPLETWFAVRAYPSESGLSVYFRDVTERKRREATLREQKERLESFASMLAHELRNPLSIAQIHLPDEGGDRALERVSTALDRIERMIDALVAVTRGVDSTRGGDPVSIDDVAAAAWESVDASSATLEAGTGLVVRTDRSLLTQLFENLLRNAVEHGGARTVRVGALADGDGFYVEDDGSGIPRDRREEVFEPGYSTSTEGLGLGLAFAAQIAAEYGWERRLVESEAGGARFEFAGVSVVFRTD